MGETTITDEEIRQMRSSASMGGLTSADSERLLDALVEARRQLRERPPA